MNRISDKQLKEAETIIRAYIPADRYALPLKLIEEVRRSKEERKLHTLDEYHEDYGDVLWWRFETDGVRWRRDAETDIYIGSPLDDHFPEGLTHWSFSVRPEPL